MLKAVYKKNPIYAFDIINDYGKKILATEDLYRTAGLEGDLVCPECGDKVILKAGDVKVPHFAHKSRGYDCYYEKRLSIESEEHKLGLQMLFKLFRSKVIYNFVELDYAFSFGRRANIYAEGANKLAIEFVATPMDYLEWKEKHAIYLENGLIPIWILSRKTFFEMKDGDYNFFERALETKDLQGILFSLDTESKHLFMAKYLEYVPDGSVYARSVFVEEYDLEEQLEVNDNGFITEDFMNKYNEHLHDFVTVFEVEYHKEKAEKEKQDAFEKAFYNKIKVIPKKQYDDNSDNRSEVNKTTENEERWGYCMDCGTYTNEWWYFEPPNKCRCYCTNKK